MFLSKIQASSADRSPFGEFWFKPVPTRGAVDTSGDHALRLAAVYACVRVLAESFAILPLRLYKPGKVRKPIRSHWLLDLLARAPNPWQTPFEWREMMMGHLAMRGNAYNEIITDRTGRITQLIPLHPDRMRIEYKSTGSEWDIRYRYLDRGGVEHVYMRDEIWHIRGLSSDGIAGLSPLSLAAETIGLGLSAQQYGSRFFQNDAKPGGGWIEYPGNFKDKEQRNTFRESWQEAQTGFNRGKVAVLEYGMKFHELGLTNKDSQFLEARQFQVGEIARFFRIPPHKIGDLTKATFSNIEQQSLEFVIDTMTPWAERWESSIETHLLGEEAAKIEPEFDFKALLRGDQAARGQYYHLGISDGWMVRNEPRAWEGLEPIDGLDEPLIPLNMVTLSQQQDAAADAEQNEPPDPNDVDPPKPGKTPPADSQNGSARAVALAGAVAERVARKEAEAVEKARAAWDDGSALVAALHSHVSFVASALAISEDAANTYCRERLAVAQAGGTKAEIFESARAALIELALGAAE